MKRHEISVKESLVVLGLAVFVTLGLWSAASFVLDVGGRPGAVAPGKPELLLPLLLTLAVILLIAALAAYAVILHGAGLATEGAQALGLPEGSVRAVLALALVLVFAIMSVFLFNQLQAPPGRVSTGLTSDQIGMFAPGQILSIDPEPSSSPQTFTVVVSPANPAASQVAQQLVTVLATLVTAVSAFYFGASTVKDLRKEGPGGGTGGAKGNSEASGAEAGGSGGSGGAHGDQSTGEPGPEGAVPIPVKVL